MSNSAFTPTTTEVTTEVPTNVPTLTSGQTYSPTLVSVSGSNLGLARTQVTWRQVGNYVHIQGTLVKDANAGSGSNPVGITMPSGLTIDWTQAGGTTSTDGFVVGSFGSYNILATNQYDRQLTAYVRGTGGSFANNAFYVQVPASGSTYTASQITANSLLYINVMIPVAEWAGSGTTTLANRAVEEYAYNTNTSNSSNTSAFANGPDGVLFPQITAFGASITKRVRFQTTILPTDVIIVEYQQAGTGAWRPASQRLPILQQGAKGYGIDIVNVSGSSTDIDIGFREGGAVASGATYGSDGELWSAYFTAGWKWRVRKVSSGAQVGYPVSARNIVGDTSGTAVPTGMIGEVLYATATVTGLASGNNTGVGGTITLTPGTWLVQSSVSGESVAPTFMSAALADSSNVEVAEDSTGMICKNQIVNATSSSALFLTSGSYYITTSSNLVRKARYVVGFGSAGGSVRAAIRAIRIA